MKSTITTWIKRLPLLLLPLLLFSCYKDKGNYDYHALNEISVKLDDNYTVRLNDTAVIKPELTFSAAGNDPSAYLYSWTVLINGAETVLSDKRDLNIPVTIPAGNYELRYRIRNQETGMQWQAKSHLTVASDVYEGYLVLNDVNGSSRLDMLSLMDGSFTQITDVLKFSNSSLPLQAEPYEVFCLPYSMSGDQYGIYLLSGSGTTRIDPETFDYNPTYQISYQIAGGIPPDFKPTYLTGNMAFDTAPVMWLFANGKVYNYSTFGASLFSVPVNVYKGSAAPFRASSYIISYWDNAVMYDVDARRFVTHNINDYTSTPVYDYYGYPEGYDLVYMESDYSGRGYAILKDAGASEYYFLQFTIAGEMEYFEEINVSDFSAAEHFAVSPEFGYLFYSAGGKLYEYDLSLKTSKLMLNKTAERISYLSFHQFHNRNINEQYAERANQLIVGAYDPAGASGTNGSLEIYEIPPVNGSLIKKEDWNGFGKIVSVSYRER